GFVSRARRNLLPPTRAPPSFRCLYGDGPAGQGTSSCGDRGSEPVSASCALHAVRRSEGSTQRRPAIGYRSERSPKANDLVLRTHTANSGEVARRTTFAMPCEASRTEGREVQGASRAVSVPELPTEHRTLAPPHHSPPLLAAWPYLPSADFLRWQL